MVFFQKIFVGWRRRRDVEKAVNRQSAAFVARRLGLGVVSGCWVRFDNDCSFHGATCTVGQTEVRKFTGRLKCVLKSSTTRYESTRE